MCYNKYRERERETSPENKILTGCDVATRKDGSLWNS